MPRVWPPLPIQAAPPRAHERTPGQPALQLPALPKGVQAAGQPECACAAAPRGVPAPEACVLRVLRQGVQPHQSLLRPPERGAWGGHQYRALPLRATAGGAAQDQRADPLWDGGTGGQVSAGDGGLGQKELSDSRSGWVWKDSPQIKIWEVNCYHLPLFCEEWPHFSLVPDHSWFLTSFILHQPGHKGQLERCYRHWGMRLILHLKYERVT